MAIVDTLKDVWKNHKLKVLVGAAALGATMYFVDCNGKEEATDDFSKYKKPKVAQEDTSAVKKPTLPTKSLEEEVLEVPAVPDLSREPSEAEMKQFETPIKPSEEEKLPRPSKDDLCSLGMYARLQTGNGEKVELEGKSKTMAIAAAKVGEKLHLATCKKSIKFDEVAIYTPRIGSKTLRLVKESKGINSRKLKEPLSLTQGTYFIHTTNTDGDENVLRLEMLDKGHFETSRKQNILKAQAAALGTNDLGRPADLEELALVKPYKDHPLNLLANGSPVHAQTRHQGVVVVEPGAELNVSGAMDDECMKYASIRVKSGLRYQLLNSGNAAEDCTLSKVVRDEGLYKVTMGFENGRGERRKKTLFVYSTPDKEALEQRLGIATKTEEPLAKVEKVERAEKAKEVQYDPDPFGPDFD